MNEWVWQTLLPSELATNTADGPGAAVAVYLNGKTTVMVDGKALSIQVGMNLTVVGSKEAARE